MGHWDEDGTYPVKDWQYEVGNGDTRLGYWDWVVEQQEAAAAEPPPQPGMQKYRVLIAATNVRTYEAVVEASSQAEADEKAFEIMPFDEGVEEIDNETVNIEHSTAELVV
jgi:hypothetical protein